MKDDDDLNRGSYTTLGNPAPGLGEWLQTTFGPWRWPIVIGGLVALLALAIWRYA